MQPIVFPGCNTIFAKDQPEYLSLPARRDQEGRVTSCWRLTWSERFKILLRGRFYITLLTFGSPLQPQLPSVDDDFAG